MPADAVGCELKQWPFIPPHEGRDILEPVFLQRIGSSLKASKQTVPNLPSAVVCKRLPCATVSLKP